MTWHFAMPEKFLTWHKFWCGILPCQEIFCHGILPHQKNFLTWHFLPRQEISWRGSPRQEILWRGIFCHVKKFFGVAFSATSENLVFFFSFPGFISGGFLGSLSPSINLVFTLLIFNFSSSIQDLGIELPNDQNMCQS